MSDTTQGYVTLQIFIQDSRIAPVLKLNCYYEGLCVGGPSAFNSLFGHGSRVHNIRPLDNTQGQVYYLDILLCNE